MHAAQSAAATRHHPTARIVHQQRFVVREAPAQRVKMVAQAADRLSAPAPLDPGQVLRDLVGARRYPQIVQPLVEPLVQLAGGRPARPPPPPPALRPGAAAPRAPPPPAPRSTPASPPPP